MLRYSHLALLLTCVLGLVIGLSFSVQPANASLGTPSSAPDQARLSAALKSAPVMFVENVGQSAAGARFQVRGGNGTIWLAEDALWATVLEKPKADATTRQTLLSPRRPDEQQKDTPRKGVNLKLSFPGANPHPTLEPFDRLDTHVSYFIGSDPKKWHADVPVWGGVRYRDLYPGIDLEITSENGEMVQRVVARDGANLNAVRLRVDGADKVALEGQEVRLTTPVGECRMPLLQLTGAANTELSRPTLAGNQVNAPFARLGAGKQSSVSSDASDLLYSTFLGGSNDDFGRGVAVDSSGAAYVTGYTYSSDFPTTPGAFDTTHGAGAFVVKLNAAGSGLEYATFLGGGGGAAIAVDSGGAAYITGSTSSSDFPTTPGAFDTTLSGFDAFVVKLNAAGSALAYATFLGGTADDFGSGIAVDSSGAAYVTGHTPSSNFPTTPGAFDMTLDGYTDAFVVKLNAAGSALAYATLLGGSNWDFGDGVTVDSSGAAYVTGTTYSDDFPTTPGAFDTTLNGYPDAFVVKLDAAGSALAYATFLGGGTVSVGSAIAVDSGGAAYITGYTDSFEFPTTPCAFDTTYNGEEDAFVAKLNATGSALAYSTFVGGSGGDLGFGIAIGSSGAAYVAGRTDFSDFPTTPGAFDTTYNGGYDAYAVKLNGAGSALVYATFLGGALDELGGDGIAVDSAGAGYVTGFTQSSDFPTTPGAFDTTYNGGYGDAYAVKLAMVGEITTYSICGRVTDKSSNPTSGVTISAGAGGTTSTDSHGYYTLSGLAAGTYTITPSKNAYTFSPPSLEVAVPPDGSGTDFTAIPDLPGAFTKTSPGNGEIGEPLYLNLYWSTSDGATSYEYCIDTTNDNTCDRTGMWTGIGTDTTVSTGRLSSGTTYYWQVRGANVTGTTEADSGAWWSFTTESLPGAFSKTSPARGTAGLPTNPSLTWGESDKATVYEYCLDTTDDDACDTRWVGVGANTTVSLSGLNNGSTYYWQVRASNFAGEMEADGGTWWSFTTMTVVPNDDFAFATPISSVPYTITQDTTKATSASDDPTFACVSTKGVASVWFQYTPTMNGRLKADTTGSNYDTVLAVWQGSPGSLTSIACNDNNGVLLTSTLSAKLIAGQEYYVEVAGKTVGGSLKLVATFTATKPAVPKLLSPAKSTKTTNPTPILDWTDSPGAAYYQVDVRKGSTAGALADSAKPAVSTYTTKSLTAGLYYWRAGACNAVGCSFTEWWSLTILKPAAPVLQSPADGSTASGTTVALDWSDSTDATSYTLQVRQDSTSGPYAVNQSVAGSAFTTAPLLNGHWYYWRVRACSAAGCGPWTASWKFKIP